jgi:hypothetical protein
MSDPDDNARCFSTGLPHVNQSSSMGNPSPVGDQSSSVNARCFSTGSSHANQPSSMGEPSLVGDQSVAENEAGPRCSPPKKKIRLEGYVCILRLYAF